MERFAFDLSSFVFQLLTMSMTKACDQTVRITVLTTVCEVLRQRPGCLPLLEVILDGIKRYWSPVLTPTETTFNCIIGKDKDIPSKAIRLPHRHSHSDGLVGERIENKAKNLFPTLS